MHYMLVFVKTVSFKHLLGYLKQSIRLKAPFCVYFQNVEFGLELQCGTECMTLRWEQQG